jgi:hypothetical protein
MKSASLFTIAPAVLTLMLAPNTRAASTADTTSDGTWWVTVNAPDYKNPDGKVSLAWMKHFPAKVYQRMRTPLPAVSQHILRSFAKGDRRSGFKTWA